jgi:ABC-type multidrug transport system fused ATPase/permease subunit
MQESDTGTYAKRYPLGVLFVHGIGNQKQGETLTSFGTPVVRWLDAWLRRVKLTPKDGTNDEDQLPTGHADILMSTLRPPDLPLGVPAHALIDINLMRAKIESSTQWLFAESWWSPQVIEPNTGRFMNWLVTRGSWIMLLHWQERMGPSTEAARQTLQALGHSKGLNGLGPMTQLCWYLAQAMLVVAVWMFTNVVLLLLWLLVAATTIVPIGAWQRRVHVAVLELTGVLGDSYVLLRDPMQGAAFETATKKSLDWLCARCDLVAIVAHSQGAAVCHGLLVRQFTPKVDLFVTVGAGIAKLEALRHQELKDASVFKYCLLAAPFWLATVLLYLRLAPSHPVVEHGLVGVLALFALSATFAPYAAALRFIQNYKSEHGKQLWLAEPRRPATRWLDLYASHDPVPNGPLSKVVPSKDPALLRRIKEYEQELACLDSERIAMLSASTPTPQDKSLRMEFDRANTASELKQTQCKLKNSVGQPIECEQVTIYASALTDHTSYWNSRTDFAPTLIEALDRCAGQRIFGGRLPQRVDNVRKQVRKDTALLIAWQFWASLASLVIVVLCLLPPWGGLPGYHATQDSAQDLLRSFEKMPLESLSGLPKKLEAGVQRIQAFVVPDAKNEPNAKQTAVGGLMLFTVCALALVLWGCLFRMLWIGYTLLHERNWKEAATISPWPQVAKWVLTLVAALPLVVAVLWALLPNLFDGKRLDEGVVRAGILLLMFVLAVIFWSIALGVIRAIVQSVADYRAQAGEAKTLEEVIVALLMGPAFIGMIGVSSLRMLDGSKFAQSWTTEYCLVVSSCLGLYCLWKARHQFISCALMILVGLLTAAASIAYAAIGVFHGATIGALALYVVWGVSEVIRSCKVNSVGARSQI